MCRMLLGLTLIVTLVRTITPLSLWGYFHFLDLNFNFNEKMPRPRLFK
jgi:hypothetical protein